MWESKCNHCHGTGQVVSGEQPIACAVQLATSAAWPHPRLPTPRLTHFFRRIRQPWVQGYVHLHGMPGAGVHPSHEHGGAGPREGASPRTPPSLPFPHITAAHSMALTPFNLRSRGDPGAQPTAP